MYGGERLATLLCQSSASGRVDVISQNLAGDGLSRNTVHQERFANIAVRLEYLNHFRSRNLSLSTGEQLRLSAQADGFGVAGNADTARYAAQNQVDNFAALFNIQAPGLLTGTS